MLGRPSVELSASCWANCIEVDQLFYKATQKQYNTLMKFRTGAVEYLLNRWRLNRIINNDLLVEIDIEIQKQKLKPDENYSWQNWYVFLNF